MYYDMTSDEKKCIELAAFSGLSVDPAGYVDFAVVLFYIAILLIGLIANIYIWFNRHYTPLKAKNISLMTRIYLHCIFFFLGDVTLCGLVHVRSSVFGNCILILVWFRSMLGNFSLGALFTIRSYKFYCVFCRNKPMQGYRRTLPYLVYILIISIVGTISTLVPRRMTMVFLDSIEFCSANENLVTTYCTMLWAVWVAYTAMMWLLRNVRSSFNEVK
ncbi:hypothetical protein GGF37_002072 [Kickxella alabastrina]|nr:hypothetical protein GGF37_002072 [Kickxella alabastrina]